MTEEMKLVEALREASRVREEAIEQENFARVAYLKKQEVREAADEAYHEARVKLLDIAR